MLTAPDLGVRLLTPPGQERAAITWAHVTELQDPRPWLSGGELVLTTGVSLRTEADSWNFIATLADAGATALGFGIAPVHEQVPAALIDAAASRRVPLIEIPATTPFIAVTRFVADWWADRQAELLHGIIDGQRSVARASVGQDPDRQIVARLARELDAWVALFDEAESVVAGSPPPGIEAWLREHTTQRAASYQHHGQAVLMHRLDRRGAVSWLAAGRAKTFNRAERSLFLMSETLLATRSNPDAAGTLEEVKALAVDLLLEGHVELGERVVAACLGQNAPTQWAVAAVPGQVEGDGQRRVGAAGRRPLLRGRIGEDQVWFLPAGSAASLGATLARAGLPVGYVDDVDPTLLTRATAGARRALDAARRRSTPSAIDVRALDRAGPLAAASLQQRTAAVELLAPLLADSRGRVLLRSLEAWFAQGFHWGRTAQSLTLHRHTLRKHVDAAFGKLGLDSDNPDHRLEVWLSLSVMDLSACVADSGPMDLEASP